MMWQAPEITHVVQAAALGREVRDVVAFSSHGPKLTARLRFQNIAFPVVKLLSHKNQKIKIILHECPQPVRQVHKKPGNHLINVRPQDKI